MPIAQSELIRGQRLCPFCLTDKGIGPVVHWGECYRESGFKDADPIAEDVVLAFERYLRALARWEER